MNTQVLSRPFVLRATPRDAAPATEAAGADDTLRRALLARLATQPWWDPAHANVFVDHGTVIYQGHYGARASRGAAHRLALGVPGVQAVWDARVPRREWQSLA
jgi:osmotically-inducible protein OsmY